MSALAAEDAIATMVLKDAIAMEAHAIVRMDLRAAAAVITNNQR